MKRNGWRLIAAALLFLTAAFLFGCGDAAKEETGETPEKSTFVEREMNIPDGAGRVLDTVILEDGSLGMACLNEETMEGTLWKSGDEGETWKQQKVFTERLPLKQRESSRAWTAALSPKGDVFFGSGRWEGEPFSYLMDGKGKVRTIEETGIRTAEFSGDGTLIFQTEEEGSGEIKRLDPKTGKTQLLAELELDLANALCCQDEELYIFTNEQCLGLSLETGEEIQVPETVQKAAAGVDNSANFENLDPQGFQILKDEDTGSYQVYSMTKKGIMRYGEGKEELLISGSETCLYTNTAELHSFEVCSSKKLFAAADCEGTDGLFSYTYAPDKVVKKTELQMYMLTKTPVFDKIIASYERNNPSVKIQVKVGMEQERGASRSDALKALNTELLAGKGPDIICLNDISAEHFMSNGLLEDLTETIAEADKREKLFTNIAECYKRDGKIYAVPTQFSFLCAGGSKQVVQAAGNLERLMDALEAESKKTPALSGDYYNIHVLMLYRAFLAKTEEEKNAISRERLKHFYSQAERMYGWYGSGKVLDAPEPMEKLDLQSLGYPSPVYYMDEEASAQLCFFSEAQDLPTMKALSNQKQVSYRCLGEEGSSLFLPKNVMGVSSKSTRKEEAKAFISFLLSGQGQGHYYSSGFCSPGISVNRGVAEAEVNSGTAAIIEGLKAEKLSKGERERAMEFFSKPSIPADTDSLFKDIVMEHLQSYLKGEKSLDQASSDAMKRLKLYLAEQE